MTRPLACTLALLALLTACHDQDTPATETRGSALVRPALDPAFRPTPADCARQVQAIGSQGRGPAHRTARVEGLLRLAAIHDRLRGSGARGAELDRCTTALREMARELALILQKEAQRTKDPEARSLAAEAHRVYLDRFEADPRATEMGFYFAELLWTQERWREAAERYEWVIARDPRGKHAQEAAYGAMLARKNLLGLDADNATSDGGTKPQPLSPDEHHLVAAFDRYLAVTTDESMRVKVMYRKARLFYDRNLFHEALPAFEAIVERHTTHELAIYSANLVLDSLNLLGRRADIARWAKQYQAMPALMKDAEFARQIRHLAGDDARDAARR